MLSNPSLIHSYLFQIFNQSLLDAYKRGVSIYIIASIEVIENISFAFEYELISTKSLSYTTHDCFVVADNDIFYTPMLYRTPEITGYMLYSRNCPALAKDTLHFYQYVDRYSHSSLSETISTRLHAISSSVRPTITPDGTISQFHTPPYILAPLRPDLGMVLTDAFYNPSNVFLYTSINPTPPNIKWMNNNFSLYGSLWAHALGNKVNISILTHRSHYDQVGLESFSNVHVRVHKDDVKIFPNFMVIDDNLYLFHFELAENYFYQVTSLVIQTNIKSIKDKFMEKFYEDWELATDEKSKRSYTQG